MAIDPIADPLIVVIPIHDDWASLVRLVADLDASLAGESLTTTLVVVNDFSFQPIDPALEATPRQAISRFIVLDLVRNLGHQRAIAAGLVWIHQHLQAPAIVVMDGDGEDRPGDVVRLYREYASHGRGQLVFAERERRSEGPLFRAFYHVYKLLFRVLTGKLVLGGNFTLVPGQFLPSLVHTSEIWNHYAAAIVKSRLPQTAIRTQRGKRYDGVSKMNFVSLIAHGLSAISVFGEVVGIRMLIASLWLAAFIVAGIAATVWIRLTTDLAIAGWATYTTGILGIILLQTIILSFVFIFMILNSRQAITFTPYPDALPFVSNRRELIRAPR